jgi:hypothetical protein
VEQADHCVIGKFRPIAEIIFGCAACFKALTQDVMRLRHERSKKLHRIRPLPAPLSLAMARNFWRMGAITLVPQLDLAGEAPARYRSSSPAAAS